MRRYGERVSSYYHSNVTMVIYVSDNRELRCHASLRRSRQQLLPQQCNHGDPVVLLSHPQRSFPHRVGKKSQVSSFILLFFTLGIVICYTCFGKAHFSVCLSSIIYFEGEFARYSLYACVFT